ncbi:hypothetical protein [Haloferula sp.]
MSKPKLTLVSSAVWKRESETEGLLELVRLMTAAASGKSSG